MPIPFCVAVSCASSALIVAPCADERVRNCSGTLERHWEGGQALRAIRDGQWDMVVLQGHSLQPVHNPGQLYTYTQKLDAEIKKIGAYTVLCMT